jgi:2-keto-4-pentenoate hydratase
MSDANRMLIEHAAQLLRDAYASGVPVPPVRTLLKDVLGEDAGYAVQRLNTKHWIAEGRRPIGCKIGLTAKAVQRQLGVDEPDYGVLFADMCLGTGEEVGVGAVLQPKVEAEIALVLDRDLDMEMPTIAEVMRATAFAVPAIEIVGSRIANWDIKLIDTVADNASAGMIVIGGPQHRLSGLDLMGCRMTMTCGQRELSTGMGSACLGSPLNAATWLAQTMRRLGTPLRAGDLIMTGALGPMAAVGPGDVVEAAISGVGSVRVAFGGA